MASADLCGLLRACGVQKHTKPNIHMHIKKKKKNSKSRRWRQHIGRVCLSLQEINGAKLDNSFEKSGTQIVLDF